ncbi:hypothetical protein PFISCL1PPCAC_12334, partial [Pristionchus fissidentatus]
SQFRYMWESHNYCASRVNLSHVGGKRRASMSVIHRSGRVSKGGRIESSIDDHDDAEVGHELVEQLLVTLNCKEEMDNATRCTVRPVLANVRSDHQLSQFFDSTIRRCNHTQKWFAVVEFLDYNYEII